MKLADLLSDWQGTQLENRWNRWIILGLLGIVLLLSLQAFRRERIVVLQPVTLSQEAWVSRDAASQSYKEAWGFYLAQLVGNVTPGSLEFVKQRLQPLLAPQIYQAVMATLQQQSQQIQQNRLTLRFEPRAVEYEAASNKLFVYGHSVEEGVSERCKKSSDRTYEFVLQIAHYAPLISALDTYQGAPRTLATVSQQEAKP